MSRPDVKRELSTLSMTDEDEEWREWSRLTPQERWEENGRLWQTYLSLGGSLDPQPDSQSPFDFPELERAVPADRRSSLYPLRRR